MTQDTLSTGVRRIDGAVAILDIQGDITSASEDALGEAYAEARGGRHACRRPQLHRASST